VSGAAKQRVVNCPQCGKPVPWSTENPYRPFCSERCRLIDLGQWASESYRVPVAEHDRGSDSERGEE
jgi:endogenous inhibitor of DNA gyrase (YacG/DUF329 family)